MAGRGFEVGTVANAAFQRAVSAARTMPLVIFDTILLAWALTVLRGLLAASEMLPPIALAAFAAFGSVIVLAPLSVALYGRFLAGEHAPRLIRALSHPHLPTYLRVSLIVTGITLAGYLGGAILADGMRGPVGAFIYLTFFGAAVIITVRLALLFPAVARGASPSHWPRAIADSAGHFWRILAVMALCSLPFLFAGFPVDELLRASPPFRPAALILAFIAAAIEVCWAVVLVGAGAEMYLALADRLRRR